MFVYKMLNVNIWVLYPYWKHPGIPSEKGINTQNWMKFSIYFIKRVYFLPVKPNSQIS